MKKQLDKPRPTTGYILGRSAFAKISAVEGLRLTPRMEERLGEFDRKGLSPSERRKAIARAFKVR